jgi:lysophospholipase L1-like esterase
MRRSLNKYLLTFLFWALPIFLISCDSRMETYWDADDQNIQYFGRVNFADPKNPEFDWPGVYIKARFKGTDCSIRLKDGNNDYNIFIDGQLTFVLKTSADTIYQVANRLSNKPHSIMITKRTEALFGKAIFGGFIFSDGGRLIKPKPKQKRKIEFIGDSFVAGYGSEGIDPDCEFSRETENNYVSYGPVLARRFRADYHVIAVSGIGVVRSFGDSLKHYGITMPNVWNRTCFNDTLIYENIAWQPDAVIIRLGRNDFWSKPYPKKSVFQNNYFEFLKNVRDKYPGAHIFALSGPVLQDPNSAYISWAVKKFKEGGDKKITFIRIPSILKRPHDFGCNWHPNLIGHQKIAAFLEPIIAEKMKWK